MKSLLPSLILLSTLFSPLTSAKSPFKPGWCGVHLTQRILRASKYSTDRDVFEFSVNLKDDSGKPIGGVRDVTVYEGLSFSVMGALPYTFEVRPRKYNAPVEVAYGDWAALVVSGGKGMCKIGGWEGRVREMDCGFPC